MVAHSGREFSCARTGWVKLKTERPCLIVKKHFYEQSSSVVEDLPSVCQHPGFHPQYCVKSVCVFVCMCAWACIRMRKRQSVCVCTHYASFSETEDNSEEVTFELYSAHGRTQTEWNLMKQSLSDLEENLCSQIISHLPSRCCLPFSHLPCGLEAD